MALPFKLVEVEWNDASSLEAGWKYIDREFKDTHGNPKSVWTAGYLVLETPDMVGIAGSLSPGGEDELNQINGGMTIPRGMIKKIRVLRGS